MKLRTLLVAIVALAAAGGAGWGGFRIFQTSTATAGPETPVTRVRRGSVAITVSARGTLQGGSPETMTAPQVAQDTLVVTELKKAGDLVQEGDVVARFDTTQQEFNLREAEADLAEAQQRVIQADADNQATDEETRYAVTSARNQVTIAELECERNAIESVNKARMNEISRDQARARLKQADQDLASRKTTGAAAMNIQRAGEARARMMADMARKNIESMTLKARTAGYVNIQSNTFGLMRLMMGMTLPAIQIGDSVRPGMAVAQIFDLKSWEVSAQVSELDRGHLAQGQPVQIAVMALGGKSFSGHVTLIGSSSGSSINPSFDCRMALDQASPELRPGMSSEVVITAQKLDNVLWTPSQALFERDGRPFVYLRTAAGFTPRDVTLVKRSESQAVITGVNEGDSVALSNPTEQNKPAAQDKSAMKALSK